MSFYQAIMFFNLNSEMTCWLVEMTCWNEFTTKPPEGLKKVYPPGGGPLAHLIYPSGMAPPDKGIHFSSLVMGDDNHYRKTPFSSYVLKA